jgi:hypothetical protein
VCEAPEKSNQPVGTIIVGESADGVKKISGELERILS